MTISFSMTAGDCVAKAMQEIGILELGGTPTSEEMTDGLLTLNAMLKSWGGEGITCWTDIDGTATIAADDPDVVLSPRPLFVTEARVVISADNERSMEEWENAEYARLPNKSASGTPTIYSLRYTPTAVTMRVWPVPTAETTVKYGYARVIEDVSLSTDTLDVPQEWLECVYVNLGKRMAGPYGAIDTNPQAAAACIARANELFAKLSDFSRPESYHLGPF